MSLLAVVPSRAAAVRPPRASAASGEAAAAPDLPAGRRPVKVILPKKKPQKWSTGMEPGEYGGGPTTVKPRKYWMGKEDRDPVGNTDDFIWNKNFLPHMERVIANGGTDTPPTIPRLTPVDEDADSGFLSINRAMSLDSVEVDLSKELLAPTESILKTQVNAARRGRSNNAEAVNRPTFIRWKLAPTRREQEQWDRATRATTGGIGMEVIDLVSSDSEDEACIHSPERKRPAWEADPSGDPRSVCTRIGGHDTQCFLEQTRLKRPLHQPSVTVKKDKEKVGERESSWATGARSLSGGSHGASGRILGAGWDSWNGRVSNSGDGRNEGDRFWGNQIGRSISVPREEPNNKDEVALSRQSSSLDIPDSLTESSSAWMSRIKGLHFPLPDENQLKARQIELDEMLALKLQEQFNREQSGSQNSQEVDATLAWTLQAEDTARARIAAGEGQSSSSQRDRSMAHLYSYGRHSPVENFTSWTANHTQAPILNRRWLPRNSNGPEFEKQNMIISQLTKGCFGQENLDFGMKIAILDSLQEALDSCEDTYTSDFEDDDYVNSIAFDDNNHGRGASDSEIDSLPLSVVKGESCRDEPCPICLDYPADGASLRHLPCMHKFHKDCIDRWLRMKTSCPVCKSSVI